MIIFGGLGAKSTVFNDLWIYDIPKNTWTELTPEADKGREEGEGKPTGRYGFGAFVTGSELCVFGGFDGKKVWNDSWTLNLGAKKPEVIFFLWFF
jgi:hypothetical protein